MRSASPAGYGGTGLASPYCAPGAVCAGGSELTRIVTGLAVLVLVWLDTAIGADGSALTIRVRNRARASDSIVQSAVATDQSIFEQAGLKTIWLIDDPQPNRRADLAMNIVRTRPPLPLTTDAMGLVWLDSHRHVLPWADIFFRDISDQATTRTETARLLANVIAHELGHLLLGPKHSSRGLMQAYWDPRTMGIALKLPLRIEPDEALMLRSAAARILAGVASASEDVPAAPR